MKKGFKTNTKYGYELTNFFIVDKEQKEPQNLLYFYPKETETQHKFRTVGLGLGLITFVESFGSELKSILNDTSDFYFYQFKKRYFICCILKKVAKSEENINPKSNGKNGSCISLNVKNYFPKNNFINSELKKCIDLYALVNEEISPETLEPFCDKFVSDYFLSEKTKILQNYLNASLFKFKIPFKVNRIKKNVNGNHQAQANNMIPVEGNGEKNRFLEGDYDEEEMFFNDESETVDKKDEIDISRINKLGFNDPNEFVDLVGIKKDELEKQNFLLNRMVPIYLKVLEEREELLEKMYALCRDSIRYKRSLEEKKEKDDTLTDFEKIKKEVGFMIRKVEESQEDSEKLKILSYFVIDGRDYLISFYNIDSENVNLILNYFNIYEENTKNYIPIMMNNKKCYLLREIRNGLQFFYIVNKKPPINLFERIEMQSFNISNTKLIETDKSFASNIPSRNNMLCIKYYSDLNLISRNLNNFFLIYMLNDFIAQKDIKEQVFKLTKDFWFVLLKKSEKRFFFIIMNEKNISLNEIDQRVIKSLLK